MFQYVKLCSFKIRKPWWVANTERLLMRHSARVQAKATSAFIIPCIKRSPLWRLSSAGSTHTDRQHSQLQLDLQQLLPSLRPAPSPLLTPSLKRRGDTSSCWWALPAPSTQTDIDAHSKSFTCLAIMKWVRTDIKKQKHNPWDAVLDP